MGFPLGVSPTHPPRTLPLQRRRRVASLPPEPSLCHSQRHTRARTHARACLEGPAPSPSIQALPLPPVPHTHTFFFCFFGHRTVDEAGICRQCYYAHTHTHTCLEGPAPSPSIQAPPLPLVPHTHTSFFCDPTPPPVPSTRKGNIPRNSSTLEPLRNCRPAGCSEVYDYPTLCSTKRVFTSSLLTRCSALF